MEHDTLAMDGPSNLVLDPHHPGIRDDNYVARRHHFFNLSRAWRLQEKGIPYVDYREEEHAVWREVSLKLERMHCQFASSIYNQGKDALGFNPDEIAQPSVIDRKLQDMTGLGLIPAEGLIPFRGFFGYLADKKLPCTQYVRHPSRPAFTPEPDVIHDMIGHVPQLANRDYVELIEIIGKATQDATVPQLQAFERLYWFTIEFGLILEHDQLKFFGAGLLSSFGEMQHALSDDVARIPFDMETLVHTSYDPSRMQNKLFVLESFEQLRNETEVLIEQFKKERRAQAQ